MKLTRRTLMAAAAMAAAYGVAPAAAADEIVIAVAGPMTGNEAAFGEQMRRGAEMAVADLNAKGGVLGKKIKLEVGDDACDAKQAFQVAQGFVAKKVVFVAGHFCSGTSIPASAVYKEEGILEISPASTNPKFTDEGGKGIYRVCGRDDQQGVAASKFINETFKGKKIAVIHDKSPYGQGLAEATKSELNKIGIKEDVFDSFTKGDTDFSALVSKLKNAGIEVLYLGGYHKEAGLLIRTMREQGMKTTLISGDALNTKEFWSITGDLGAGTLFSFSPDPRKNPEAAEVVKRFKAKGDEAEGYTLYTYGAIQVWANAATKANSVKVDDVVKVMGKDQFDTVLGKIGFDAKGDVTAPGYVFYEWKNGNYDYYAAK